MIIHWMGTGAGIGHFPSRAGSRAAIFSSVNGWPPESIFNGSVIPISGVITHFRIFTPGNVALFKIYKNGADTGVSLGTPSFPGNQFKSTDCWVPVSAGDIIAIRVGNNPIDSSGNISDLAYAACVFRSSACQSMLTGGMVQVGAIGSGSTAPICGMSFPQGPGDSAQIVSTPGVLGKMYVYLDVAPGVGNSWTFRVRKNGVDTAMVVTISGTATTASLLNQTLTVVAGDLIEMRTTQTGSVPVTMMRWGFAFKPTTRGQTMYMCGSRSGTLSTTVKSYGFIIGAANSYPISNVRVNWFPIAPPVGADVDKYVGSLAVGSTIKHMRVSLNNAPGVGKSYTFSLFRRARSGGVHAAGAATALSVTISGTDTEGSNLVDEVQINNDDLISWEASPSGTPTSPTQTKISCVVYDPSENCGAANFFGFLPD